MSEVRTLIVDDSSVMRKIVERALRQAGLDTLVVLEAGSGTEGLDVLKAQKVDLILSDINMPSMDGLEFLRERGACQAGHPVRGAGIHPQAIYGRAGEGTGAAVAECGVAGRRHCAIEWSA